MRSATPKLLHPLCGRPLIAWTVAAARAAGAAKVVVVGGPDRALAPGLPDDVVLAVQQQPRGTADAVQAAAAEIDRAAPVIVIYGDVPLITGASLHELAVAHAELAAAATMLTMVPPDPTGYGRVVRGPDGAVERVVETKKPGDATSGGAGDPRGQQRHLRVRRRSAAGRARGGSRRQRAGRAVPARRAGDPARRRPRRAGAPRSTTRRSRSASTTAATSRRSARRRSSGSSRRTWRRA